MSYRTPLGAASKREIPQTLGIKTLFISCMASAMLPVLVLWILFSTPRTRRQSVFWLQLLAITMSLAHGMVNAAYLTSVLDSSRPRIVMQLQCSARFLKWCTPIVTDAALIFRAMAFYPPQLYTRKERVLVMALPATFTIARLINAFVLVVTDVRSYRPGFVSFHRLYLLDSVLQVFGNIFLSMLMLVRIYKSDLLKLDAPSTRSRSRNASRLLFEACTLSFAPAVLLQIALMTSSFIWYNHASRAAKDVARLDISPFLLNANIYVSIVFSLLATSWTTLSNAFAGSCNTADGNRRSQHHNRQARRLAST